MAFAFSQRDRVRFGETDLQAVVFFPNYFAYATACRDAYLRSLGLGRPALLARGLDYTVGEVHGRYQASLRFEDEYVVGVRVAEVGNSSWTFEFGIERADGLSCAEIRTVQVMLDRATAKAVRIPDDVRALFASGGG